MARTTAVQSTLDVLRGFESVAEGPVGVVEVRISHELARQQALLASEEVRLREAEKRSCADKHDEIHRSLASYPEAVSRSGERGYSKPEGRTSSPEPRPRAEDKQAPLLWACKAMGMRQAAAADWTTATAQPGCHAVAYVSIMVCNSLTAPQSLQHTL